MSTLKHGIYEGTAEVDVENGTFFGKILFVDDLVLYEGTTVPALQSAFEEAVVDYIALCADIGKEPQRPFKGAFNVRVAPTLHQRAARRALADGVSLNEIVSRALQVFLNRREEPVQSATNEVIVGTFTERSRTDAGTKSNGDRALTVASADVTPLRARR